MAEQSHIYPHRLHSPAKYMNFAAVRKEFFSSDIETDTQNILSLNHPKMSPESLSTIQLFYLLWRI